MSLEDVQFFPADRRLQKKLGDAGPSKKERKFEDVLTVIAKEPAGEQVAPLPASEKKSAPSAEAEAMAKRRLEISKQLEQKVSSWFKELVSSGLDEAEVKKEIGDFLDKIEGSAEATNVIDLKMPRAPQDYYQYRLYQLLRALVTGASPEDVKPTAYIKFDMEGELSMFNFMSSLAEKAKAKKLTENKPNEGQKAATQENVLSFSTEDIFLCPKGHAIHKNALGPETDCPRHGDILKLENLGRRKGSIRRSFFLMKYKDGKLDWALDAPAAFETDVLTKDGTYRAFINPPVAPAPSGK